MNPPECKTRFADAVAPLRVAVAGNERIAESTWRMRFAAPQIARRIVPGQFLMVRIAHLDDPLIGRALALYDVVPGDGGQPEAIEVVYLVAGKMTRLLARARPGQELDIWGPLGNGFAPPATDHLVMVAGGIGQTPFLALAKEAGGRQRYGRTPPSATGHPERITLCYGARRASLLACVDDFRAAGVDVQVATEDGSAGRTGRVTELLEQILAKDNRAGRLTKIVCCGPEPMMAAVSRIAHERAIPAEVSLETPMACGVGICFSCVAPLRDGQGQVDYHRTCVEGPVFDAQRVVWDF